MADDATQGDFANLRASALFAAGAPREAIDEVLKAPSARFLEDSPEDMRAKVDVAFGDFASAEARQKMLEEIADAPQAVPHAGPTSLLLQSLIETGRPTDAFRVARDYLRRKDGWVHPPMWATAELLGELKVSGALTAETWSAEIARQPDAPPPQRP